jgi:hypothetical protein
VGYASVSACRPNTDGESQPTVAPYRDVLGVVEKVPHVDQRLFEALGHKRE